MKNLDGARYTETEIPKFQVWTSALGKKLLEQKGFLRQQNELHYH